MGDTFSSFNTITIVFNPYDVSTHQFPSRETNGFANDRSLVWFVDSYELIKYSIATLSLCNLLKLLKTGERGKINQKITNISKK